MDVLQDDMAALEQVEQLTSRLQTTPDSRPQTTPDSRLQTPDSLFLTQVVTEISEDAAENGIKYFEISLDPYKFISKDRSQTRVLDVVRCSTLFVTLP